MKLFKIMGWVILFLLFAMACSLGFTSCYTPKKANRQLYKVHSNYPELTAPFCGDLYPPIDAVRDSIIYKRGETIYKQGATNYVYLDCDSVVKETKKNGSVVSGNKVKLPCPPCDSARVDTFYRHTKIEKVDRATAKQLVRAKERIAEINNTKKLLWYAVAVLAFYTLLRWVLRMVWRIKLP